jgi:TonB family protein
MRIRFPLPAILPMTIAPLLTLLACAYLCDAFTARATDMVPYIAMPVGIGYAIDAKGNHFSNVLCVRDAVFAPHPQYPNQLWSSIGDTAGWARYKGDGLYRLDIDLSTGRVSQVTVIKSTGLKILDTASTDAFKRWVFRPGKWKEITIPVAVRTKAGGVISK